MTVFDRLTRPLAPIDRPVNAVNDGTVRMMPWVWWPASAPRPDRSWGAGQHVEYVGCSPVAFVVGEVVAVGAWDRRAARLRRRRLPRRG